MAKIMFHGVGSNIPTGYGRQTKLFTPALQNAGFEVTINAILDQYATGLDSNGIINLASGPRQGMLGNDFFAEHANRLKPDIVLSMVDPFTCKPELFDKTNWFPWVMVHGEPLLWENKEVLKACVKPIAPTPHAKKVLIDAGFDPYYCPLAVDTEVFKPIDRQEARKAVSEVWDTPIDKDTFIVVANAANHSRPSRKNFGAMFKAWGLFQKEHNAENCVLYIHTEREGELYSGENLKRYEELYGDKGIVYAPQYEYCCGTLPESYLTACYNAADVYLCTSTGEGFGLPIVEAQACGCPVIAPNFGSMADNVFTGSLVSGQMFNSWEVGSECFLVDNNDIAGTLCKYNAGVRGDVSSAVIASLVSQFDIKAVTENHLLPMLKDIVENQILMS